MRYNYSIPKSVRMLHFEFPKNDDLFNNINEISKITDKKYNKIILWMLTFRKNTTGRSDSDANYPLGLPLFTQLDELKILDKFLISLNCLLLIKLHPFQDLSEINKIGKYQNIRILSGEECKMLHIDVYKLMGCADYLLSDYYYSSYSFILLNKPIGFILSDEESYKLGFLDNPPDYFLPGNKIYTVKDFYSFIEKSIGGFDEYSQERNSLVKWMYEYKDGRATERVCEFIIQEANKI